MADDVTALIGNDLDLHPTRRYGAILGLAPSKGARSPLLWRAAFAKLGIDADFHPFDVTEDALPRVVDALRADDRFIGGAVAVPHKELLLPLLDQVDAAAAGIGAVNALRRTADGGIAGANTDGLAAVDSLKALAGDLAGQRVALLGLGGAGKAVATCLALDGAEMAVWNRDGAKAEAFAAAHAKVTAAPSPDAALDGARILVNCTSVGFAADGRETDETPVPAAALAALPADGIVFDIIYQPPRTCLLKDAAARGLTTLNGKPMNLGQAVIAFRLALPDADPSSVEAAMMEV